MTILKQFDRLETPGVWHAGPEAQRLDVIVSLGKTTLVITDTKENPVAHWALTAIVKAPQSPGPATTFHPDDDASEALEIQDQSFCDAIEEIQNSLRKHTPRPGRLRLVLFTFLALVIGYFAIVWAPSSIVSFAASATTNATAKDIGARMHQELGKISGPYCQSTLGDRALSDLSDRMSAAAVTEISVLPQDRTMAIILPGGHIVLGKSMVEDFDSAAVVAGFTLEAAARLSPKETMEVALQGAGIWAAAGLLIRGNVSEAHIKDMTKGVISYKATHAVTEDLINAFDVTEISTSDYAYSLIDQPIASQKLLSGDPHKSKATETIIADGLWIGLQEICSP